MSRAFSFSLIKICSKLSRADSIFIISGLLIFPVSTPTDSKPMKKLGYKFPITAALAALFVHSSISAEQYEFRMNVKGLEPQQSVPEPEPGHYLRVINPVPGKSGIYIIDTGDTGYVNAYVNMDIEGGPWILVAKWRSALTEVILASEIIEKGSSFKTWSDSPETYPAIPTGIINASTAGLFTSTNTSWTRDHGSWQRFDLFPSGYTFTRSGFPVTTPVGVKTMYSYDTAWNRTPTLEETAFSLWPVPDSSGPCGGPGYGGSNRICPVLAKLITGHFDWSSDKMLFVKEAMPQ